MAVVQNVQSVLEKGMLDAKKFAEARGEAISVGGDALERASAIQNSDFSRGGGFEQGDIIMVPDEETLKGSLMVNTGNKKPSASFLLPVMRRGTLIALRVYPAWFNLAVHPIDEKGAEKMDDWHKHQGKPAEDFRNCTGSVVDAFLQFCGKNIKVDSFTKLACLVLKRGAVANVNGGYDKSQFEPGKRKFYTYSYVEDDSAAPAADSAAPATA